MRVYFNRGRVYLFNHAVSVMTNCMGFPTSSRNELMELMTVMTEKYGPALLAFRKAKGITNQLHLAQDSVKAAEKHPMELEAFSQQWLSRLEGDYDGSRLIRSKVRQLRCLAYLLSVPSDDFEKIVGISIGRIPLDDDEQIIDKPSSEMTDLLRYTVVMVKDMETGDPIPFARTLLRRTGEGYEAIALNDKRLMDARARERLKGFSFAFVDIEIGVGDSTAIDEGDIIVAQITKKQLVLFEYKPGQPIVLNTADEKNPKILKSNQYKIVGVCEAGLASLRKPKPRPYERKS